MTVAVISSLYGSYDVPVPPVEQTLDAEYILVTDLPITCDPWNVIVEPRPQLHPRLAAKVAKCRPDLYTDADVTIWVDASFHIHNHEFIAWCMSFLAVGDLAQVPHPERQSIVVEAEVSATMAKYAGLPSREQVTSYIKAGFPDPWGLWATGLIVRANRSKFIPFGDAWLREQLRWTYQDQLSEAPVLHQHALRPVDMDLGLWHNPYFQIRGHRDHL